VGRRAYARGPNFREPDTGEGRRISLSKQFSEQDVRALPLDKRQLQFTNSLDLNGAETQLGRLCNLGIASKRDAALIL
jgi:hypothetical protein